MGNENNFVNSVYLGRDITVVKLSFLTSSLYGISFICDLDREYYYKTLT